MLDQPMANFCLALTDGYSLQLPPWSPSGPFNTVNKLIFCLSFKHANKKLQKTFFECSKYI